MQKNVCLQQDICLYPDKTIQKLKSASRVISARSMSHNTHLRYNFTDKTLKNHNFTQYAVVVLQFRCIRGTWRLCDHAFVDDVINRCLR